MDEKLIQVLEAGTWSPTSMGAQHPHIIFCKTNRNFRTCGITKFRIFAQETNYQNRTTMRNLRRIDQWMVMMAIVCMVFLTGCGKSAKEGENASGESKDTKEVTTKQA